MEGFIALDGGRDGLVAGQRAWTLCCPYQVIASHTHSDTYLQINGYAKEATYIDTERQRERERRARAQESTNRKE